MFSESEIARIVPLRCISGQPTISGQKLDFGKLVEFRGEILVTSALDLLLIVPKSPEDPASTAT